MIKVFNEIYDGLSTSLGSGVSMSSVDTNTPSTYPFVSMVEINDSVYEQGSDCCHIENFAEKEYELNVYTNLPNKKSKCDTLCEQIDDYLTGLGLTRTAKIPLPALDETIYRVVLRYRGIVSKDHTIYRR